MTQPVVIGRPPPRWTAIYAFEEHGGEVRYVGKTSQYLIDRRKAHLRECELSRSRPVNRWLRKRMTGPGFVTRLIEHVPPERDWAERERHWIRYYRERGDRLLNLTDGGEGLAGHKLSVPHRLKIATALMNGESFACETCGAQFYRKRSAILRGQNRFCSRGCSNRRFS